MIEAAKLKSELAMFTGSENLFRHPMTRMVYTDGIQHFARQAQAYWFLDIVGTEILPYTKTEDFITVELIVSEGSKAVIKADDGNGRVLHTRQIDFTDAPVGTWRFYLIGTTFLLTSEY